MWDSPLTSCMRPVTYPDEFNLLACKKLIVPTYRIFVRLNDCRKQSDRCLCINKISYSCIYRNIDIYEFIEIYGCVHK